MQDRKHDIEVVITSYNRWHLLKPCVESLFDMIGDRYKITLIEDSVSSQMKENIINTFGNKINFIFNEERVGQIRSIDKAYNQVNSKYILKVEDDYVFNGNNKNFIAECIDVLEDVPHVHHIWIRHLPNFAISHGYNYEENLFEPNVLTTKNNVPYRMLKENHYGGWSGFTFSPHVERLSDYKMMFPNGYFYISKEKIGVFGEQECSNYTKYNFKLRAAHLLNTCCETGHVESTYR